MKNMLVFVVAAFLEIAGCFAFWAWLRNGVRLCLRWLESAASLRLPRH